MDGPRPNGLGAREAQRALIVEALAGLRDAHDPEAAARDVMRALDAYIDSAAPRVRETPVTDYSRAAPPDQREARWAMWAVLGCAVLATVVAAVVLDGGWIAGAVMMGIWVTALFALVSS
jgi:hypothetical protein